MPIHPKIFRFGEPMMAEVISAPRRGRCAFALIGLLLLLITPQGSVNARTGPAVAPPRTIADITAILDEEKPDSDRIAKMRADADASPPQNADAAALVDFYYSRGVARQDIGRLRVSIADLKTGIAIGREHDLDVGYLQQTLGFQRLSARLGAIHHHRRRRMTSTFQCELLMNNLVCPNK
jgi:hypothetical protein